jgi:putative transposase
MCRRQKANVTLSEQIREAFVASDETYGMPRMRAERMDAGIVTSRKRIAHLMRQEHMRGVSRRRSYCVTTERDVRHRPAPDLVKRQFVATDLNPLWVADMTCIPTWVGLLYLSVVIDVYSRKVVGWAFGERMSADLVVLALNMALMTRKPQSGIHHCDQGSQYTSITVLLRNRLACLYDARVPADVTDELIAQGALDHAAMHALHQFTAGKLIKGADDLL